MAYVSEQNLLADAGGGPVGHPQIEQLFNELEDGRYKPRPNYAN